MDWILGKILVSRKKSRKRGINNHTDQGEASTSLTISQSDQSEIQTASNEVLNTSKNLTKRCHLNDSMSTGDEMLVPAQEGRNFDNREAIANEHSNIRGESRISNSNIKAGRDMNSYHVTGSFVQVFHKYENAHLQKVTTAANVNTSESGRDFNDRPDDVAAGMIIPSLPPCILERDSQHNKIVTNLISVPNANIAILGMGGIGKTTLACSVARDPKIVDAYQRRLFLSFEGCSTADLAYTNLAAAFHIPAEQGSSHNQIISQVLNYLTQAKTLLIIDNFETYWEVPSNRRAAEELLGQLGAVDNLAMIVTLRGIQRPGNICWVKIEPLQTLTDNASTKLLSVITNEDYAGDDSSSECVRKLLDGVAGIPLAVTLVGGLLRDNCETPQSLWRRWTRESTQAIGIANDTEPDDRLYKLDVSLRISIFGPRMSDNTKEVLAVIAILPIGLNMDDGWLDSFQNILSSIVNIRSCISALRNAALCTLESTSSTPRIRLLPPVRDFCLRNLALNGVLARKLIDMYITDLIAHLDRGSSVDYTWVTMELSNISAILNLAITHHYVPDDFGSAIYEYTEWRRFLCIPETDTVERAIEILSEHPQAKAECLQALGTTLSNTSREKEAIQPLEQALSIHRKLEDKREVGWDLYRLGGAYYRLDDHANAEHYLSEARDLVTEIDNKRNKGGILETLANMYLKQDKLPQAESAAKEALELARASGDRIGETNALLTLGRVYHKQGKYGLAVETLTACRDASQAIHDTHTEACANESLGYVYRDVNKPDQAALHLRLAISLFERAQSFKEANKNRSVLEELERSLGKPNDQ